MAASFYVHILSIPQQNLELNTCIMLDFRQYSLLERFVISEDDPQFSQEQNVQNTLFEIPDYVPDDTVLQESVEDHPTSPNKIIFRNDGDTMNKVKSIAVPRHMWEGGKSAPGMKVLNQKR